MMRMGQGYAQRSLMWFVVPGPGLLFHPQPQGLVILPEMLLQLPAGKRYRCQRSGPPGSAPLLAVPLPDTRFHCTVTLSCVDDCE